VAAKGLKRHVALPTLLTGYGGFEVSLKSYYSGILGRTWLSRGGYVVANIRGGGKYGPGWRQATLKKHPPRAFFATVAYDLAARKITSARQLGIENGSNGGLPVGNMLVCQVTYWKW
jgi:prolyl oligopeptidase